jgi:hypothetical protein
MFRNLRYVQGDVRELSTDHELIPARNASFATMNGSVSRCSLLSNVKTFTPQRKKWKRLLQCLNYPMFALRLWITTTLCRWPVVSLPSTCMLCTPPALHQGRLHPAGINSWSVDSRGEGGTQVELLNWEKTVARKRIIELERSQLQRKTADSITRKVFITRASARFLCKVSSSSRFVQQLSERDSFILSRQEPRKLVNCLYACILSPVTVFMRYKSGMYTKLIG